MADARVTARAAKDPAWIAIAASFSLAVLVGCTWGLPGSDSWAADSISPRSCGLGAIVETYWPGHFHTYPPLHMALLTLLSLPWMALAAHRVGLDVDALSAELVKPLYMTGIEVSARLLAAVMALGILLHTFRLWTRIGGRRVGVLAAAVTAGNATLVYYAHTGNLEVPYLFWMTWAMLEMDRVMSGEPREVQALLLVTAAVLTKDQAAAALLLPLPLALVVVPWRRGRTFGGRRRLMAGGAVVALTYALASGALTNPSGFRKRVAFLLGPASRTWASYPRTLPGRIELTRDAIAAVPHFASWGTAAAAAAGVVVVALSWRGLARDRGLAPLAAAVSFTIFFTLGALRTEDRFLLPQSLFFFPYAAVALDAAWTSWGPSPRVRQVLAGGAAVAFVPAVFAVASIDATLLADPRYAAEAYLKSFVPGTPIEVYGGPIFLPRIPATLVALRPGVEPIADRQRIAGVEELVDPAMDPRPRAPAAIVLATELSHIEAADLASPARPCALAQYGDATSHAFFRRLQDGSLGYGRSLRAVCTLPWPLECRREHGSTGGEVWVYVPRVPARASAAEAKSSSSAAR